MEASSGRHGLLRPVRLPRGMACYAPDRAGRRMRNRRPPRRGLGAEQPGHGSQPAAGRRRHRVPGAGSGHLPGRRVTGRGQARAANNLAFNYRFLGRHEEAAAALNDALAVQRQVGDRYGEGIALCNLGEAYLEIGRLDDAIIRSREALAIVRDIGSARVEGYALCNLGRANLDLGHAAVAADMLGQALAIHRAEGDRYGEAQDLQYIGSASAQAGRLAEARTAWQRACSLFAALGEGAPAAEFRSSLLQLDAQSAD